MSAPNFDLYTNRLPSKSPASVHVDGLACSPYTLAPANVLDLTTRAVRSSSVGQPRRRGLTTLSAAKRDGR
eukprot:8669027-Pyramimonas_sp.AAC.1